MKPQKILYHYSSSQIDTGSPVSLLRMVDSLDRKRFTPVFLASKPGQLLDEMGKRNVEVIEQPVTGVEWRRPRSLKAIYGMYRLLKSHGIHLVHMNQPGWNEDIVVAAFFARIPVVLHIRNPARLHKNNLNWRIASRILLCSHALKTSVTGFERVKAKSIVLHNAVDTERFAAGTALRSFLGFSDNDIVIGTVAQICYRKGIDLFLKTAEQLGNEYHEVKWLIIGPPGQGEEDYCEAMREKVATGPLKGSVSFLGSRQDIPDLLASMDLFFFPTRDEPFGLVIIEAMAAGLPIVASNVGGIPEIINSDSVGSAVSPPNVEQFKAAITDFLNMPPEIRQEMATRARERSAQFSIAKLGSGLQQIYDQLI